MTENKDSDNKVKFLPITEDEKADLETRIFTTIQKNKSKKLRIRLMLGVAASMALLGGIGFYFFNAPSRTPSIIDFVKTTNSVHQENSNKVTLILGEGDELRIDEETSEISYSNTGKNITIGTVQTISQEVVKNEKPVYNTLMVPYGKRLKTELSDGSLVWLNSGSKMVYPVVFSGDKREVYIEGEAIFEVSHNKEKSFFVISENQVIEVLGTVFGVTTYADETYINTVLKSGSVQISYHDSTTQEETDKIKISPGTKASYDKRTNGIVSEKVDVDTYFSWREGLFIFKNDDLRFIMKRISRYYNVQVDISDEISTSETFSGYLNLNEDIDKVLTSIKESTDLEYKHTENGITIN